MARRQTDMKAESKEKNRQTIRCKDWQAGWSSWQAARRGCKWTAGKAEQHSDALTPEQPGRLTGGETDRWIDTVDKPRDGGMI